MSKVTELGDVEKSRLLARLCEWQTLPARYGVRVLDKDGVRVASNLAVDDTDWVVNLYTPGNMQMAWRVLNWVIEQDGYRQWSNGGSGLMIDAMTDLEYLASCQPKDAQRAWLDMVLQLAEEAGLVK